MSIRVRRKHSVGLGPQRLCDTSAKPAIRRMLPSYLTAGIAFAGASVIAVPPNDVQQRAVRLIDVDSADSPLGDGTALIMGPSGLQLPGQNYLDAADTLYLEPRGFTGTTQALFTPEGDYPTTGVASLPYDTSVAQGQQLLDSAIQSQIAGGNVDATNPVVVVGFSQSGAISGMTMQRLADQGVPSDDVHFVLLGPTTNPDGGMLARFDIPGTNYSFPGVETFSSAAPANLYPTDVYTLEYDGVADFPQYPIDPLSDLNALAGAFLVGANYLDLTPTQIQGAIQLPTSAADGLTNYYMIPTTDLPLLDPLRAIPIVGNPLADLLQPDMTVLVNLGYGSITDGWSQGDADVSTPFGLFPTDLNWSDVLSALANGATQGIQAAVQDLENPDNYQMTSLLDSPTLSQFIDSAYTEGLINTTSPSLLELAQGFLGYLGFPISDATLLSSPNEIINDLTNTLSADYASLTPIADSITSLLTTLPAYDASLFVDQLEAGNALGAIGDPIAADMALIPFELTFGAGISSIAAVGGTLVNLVDLIPGW